MSERAAAIRFAAGIELAGERATAEVVALLRASGVGPVVLKGPFAARWLRPHGGDRYSTDVDLLVGPDERGRAEAALREAGYERLFVDHGGKDAHADTWVRDGSFSIDLHQTLVGVGAPPNVAWRLLSLATERIVVGAIGCIVLDAPARALHVVLHAAQHGPSDPHVLDDLSLVLERVDRETWVTAARLAEQLQALDAFSAGLALSPSGRGITSFLDLPPVATSVVALRAMGAPPTALGFERLANAHGLRARATLLGRELVPGASFMRVWHPLARKGRRGLLLAYALRPFWLLRWALPGVRAWVRAKRLARSAQQG